jgi:hypothetical protein
MVTMSDPLEWIKKSEDEYEARGKRRYVIWKESGPAYDDQEWMVLACARPNSNVDVGVKPGGPVSKPTLQEAKLLAQWWEDELELWPKPSS